MRWYKGRRGSLQHGTKSAASLCPCLAPSVSTRVSVSPIRSEALYRRTRRTRPHAQDSRAGQQGEETVERDKRAGIMRPRQVQSSR